jgi:hypothetical protein
MGTLPWPLMGDDTVRHLVLSGYHLLHYSAFARAFMAAMLTHLDVLLEENTRPSLPPPSNLVDVQLMDVICASWDRVPSNRPSFEKIERDLQRLRVVPSAQNVNLRTFDTEEHTPPVVGRDAQNSHISSLPTSQSSEGQPDNAAPQRPHTIYGITPILPNVLPTHHDLQSTQ